jgi:hypothetical protein
MKLDFDKSTTVTLTPRTPVSYHYTAFLSKQIQTPELLSHTMVCEAYELLIAVANTSNRLHYVITRKGARPSIGSRCDRYTYRTSLENDSHGF